MNYFHCVDIICSTSNTLEYGCHSTLEKETCTCALVPYHDAASRYHDRDSVFAL